ncbi:hypothetical protein GALMADRAFT_74855 [Galerina marginata CBS 339.88]|uniref:Uncharacterized protein n=1 Tax=Galerina marginata (strain CBS 339.88) TaxID=685588 RepID=A0A067SXT3_GALM3|nr:hypothetical protein GALMADRAFT_74855 [Galerina marginata CBS 339.88]
MVDIHDIPPEILITAFEIGIFTFGISFLAPLSLVCQDWHDIINQTPRLWGIISIFKRTPPSALERQVTKAKASPLYIMIAPDARLSKHKKALKELIDLAGNWVVGDLGYEVVSATRWIDLYNSLEGLSLHGSRPTSTHNDPRPFFEGITNNMKRGTKLHSFTANGISRPWTLGFLGPSIKYFSLRRDDQSKMMDTWDYLVRLPEATTIELEELNHRGTPLARPTITLHKLNTLRLRHVRYSAQLLSSIAAPALQILSIDHTLRYPNTFWYWQVQEPNTPPPSMVPFFLAWSEPIHRPTNLHTLELINSIKQDDVPFLIRWLARLPNLSCLYIKDDSYNAIGQAAAHLLPDGQETDLYKALSRPVAGPDQPTWLCPSLSILHLDSTHEIADLISIARGRSGIDPHIYDIPPPKPLHILEAYFCAGAKEAEIELLHSLVGQAYCLCLSCDLDSKPRHSSSCSSDTTSV